MSLRIVGSLRHPLDGVPIWAESDWLPRIGVALHGVP